MLQLWGLNQFPDLIVKYFHRWKHKFGTRKKVINLIHFTKCQINWWMTMIRLYHIFWNVIFYPFLYFFEMSFFSHFCIFLGLSRVSFEYRTDHSKRPLVVVEMEDIILAKMEIITKTRPKGPLVVSNLFLICVQNWLSNVIQFLITYIFICSF